MTPDVERALLEHRLGNPDVVHTNLRAEDCACQRLMAVPRASGNACGVCGGMMVRTGTCETCTSCGTTGGCG